MRTARYPKPVKRSPKPLRPIRRGTLPRARVPAREGDHRARYKYALGLWAKLVKQKEPSGICPMCLKRRWHDSAHCWAKGPYKAISLDLTNGAPLCRSCHRRVDSDHHAKREFFVAYMGPEEYERLRLMASGRYKMDLGMATMALELEAGGA